MDLTLVRHGEPRRAAAGTADPGLGDRGREQARQVAHHLAVENVAAERYAALYTSPLRRARETAEPVADALGLHAIVDEDLAEFDRDAPYVHFEDLVAAGDPRVQAYYDGDLSGWGADAGEFAIRVVDAFDRIIAAHAGERVLVVGHGGVTNAFFAAALRLDRISFFAPAYASICRARAGGGRITVVSLNECGHLAGRGGHLTPEVARARS